MTTEPKNRDEFSSKADSEAQASSGSLEASYSSKKKPYTVCVSTLNIKVSQNTVRWMFVSKTTVGKLIL